MPTRLTAVLVLFATLLAVAPVVPATVSLRDSVSIVSARGERQRQRHLHQKLSIAFPPRPNVGPPPNPTPGFSGFAHPHFQRPPPVFL